MKIRKIESPKNPLVKEALKIRERRSLYGHAAFLIEGPHLLEMALDAKGGEIKQIFFTNNFIARHGALIKRMARAELFEVTEGVIGKLSETEAPQGVVAVASLRPQKLEDISPSGTLAVLDGIQEPGNLGGIIRTADAAGAGGIIILPGTCDPFEGKALRASAGSIFNIPVIYEDRITLVEKLHKRGIKAAVTMPASGLSLFDADLGGPIAFIFGNEARGVSEELKKGADLTLRIPIAGHAESLNVAASAAVCLYEALRQRGDKKRGAMPPPSLRA